MPYADTEVRRARVRAYWRDPANRETTARARRRWREKYPERRAAQVAVGNALRDGRLVRPESCSIEGCDRKPEAHHHDYARPLDVTWLCRQHHAREHRKGNAA